MRIHTLDLRFQGTPGIIAAFLVESGKDLALIETGPGSTLATLQEQIRAHGFAPENVRHVFVTHVHLDHSGAAGWWAQQGATVFAHPRAAPHLTDPTKLLDSSRRVYGDKMDTLWGEILPAPEKNVVALRDGETAKVGKLKIIALDTPGHARHHHAYVCEDICFTGDVAGVRLEQSAYLSVAAAPPQFDPVAYGDSLARLDGMKFRVLHLTHFGEVTDVGQHLAGYASRVEQVYEFIRARLDEGLKHEALALSYEEAEHALATRGAVSEALWQRYQLANHSKMCAEGIALYCEKNPV
jgi:glyoxylase-like metal-dependent hydrolase (beta-lactamase superfamily II)